MLAPNAPQPLHATHDASGLITVTFDRQLQPGTLAPANWSGKRSVPASRVFDAGAGPVTAAGATVTFQETNLALGIGPDRISYAATPADVKALDGTPAAPFTDFPLTEV